MGSYKKGGWEYKYHIEKVDGSPVDPEAEYFVLRLDKDPHARVAAMAYAESVRRVNYQFADDIVSHVEQYHAIKRGKRTKLEGEEGTFTYPAEVVYQRRDKVAALRTQLKAANERIKELENRIAHLTRTHCERCGRIMTTTFCPYCEGEVE